MGAAILFDKHSVNPSSMQIWFLFKTILTIMTDFIAVFVVTNSSKEIVNSSILRHL